jgi:hypothetical protein
LGFNTDKSQMRDFFGQTHKIFIFKHYTHLIESISPSKLLLS